MSTYLNNCIGRDDKGRYLYNLYIDGTLVIENCAGSLKNVRYVRNHIRPGDVYHEAENGQIYAAQAYEQFIRGSY